MLVSFNYQHSLCPEGTNRIFHNKSVEDCMEEVYIQYAGALLQCSLVEMKAVLRLRVSPTDNVGKWHCICELEIPLDFLWDTK